MSKNTIYKKVKGGVFSANLVPLFVFVILEFLSKFGNSWISNVPLGLEANDNQDKEPMITKTRRER